MVVLSRRRLAALVALVVVALTAVVVAVISAAGGPKETPTPRVLQGGSSFGAGVQDGAERTTEAAPREPEAPRPAKVSLTAAQARQLGQLFMVGFRGRTPEDEFFVRLAERRWGAVILDDANYEGPEQLTALTDRTRSVMADAGLTPPLVAMAQGGGEDSAVGALGPAAQPSVGSLKEARSEATRASRALRRLGVRMTLAPSADLGYAGAAWDGRAFSGDAAQVGRVASAAIAGWRTGGVAPAVGHFPGEGAASQDPSAGSASVGLGLPELEAADLQAFDGPLKTAPALVLSNALYAAFDGVTPATLLPEVPARARRAGYKGVIVSGNLAATVLATGDSIAAAAVQALKAGSDLLWIPGDAADQAAAYRAVVRAVEQGDIPKGRVDGALARVAALKRKFAAR